MLLEGGGVCFFFLWGDWVVEMLYVLIKKIVKCYKFVLRGSYKVYKKMKKVFILFLVLLDYNCWNYKLLKLCVFFCEINCDFRLESDCVGVESVRFNFRSVSVVDIFWKCCVKSCFLK